MQIIFCNEGFPEEVKKTLFLAGPSPRKSGESNWRVLALELLATAGYDGTVFVPMTRKQLYGESFDEELDYEKQCEWEQTAMDMADVILFYVCRRENNQGLTTNVEFGKYLKSGRIVYARPEGAIQTRYLDNQAYRQNLNVYSSLTVAINRTISLLGNGVQRKGIECFIPAVVFCTKAFQSWYRNFLGVGNKLSKFTVESIYGSIYTDGIFGFVGRPTVDITTERRSKSDELIFARSPISITGLYYQHEDGKRSYILVREFRAAVNNNEGYVYEFPSGSDKEGTEPLANAAKELVEETGLHITDLSRFVSLGAKQLFATFMSTPADVFALSLTKEEFESIQRRADNNETLGENSYEQIKLFIASDEDLYNDYPIDLATHGIINLIKGFKL